MERDHHHHQLPDLGATDQVRFMVTINIVNPSMVCFLLMHGLNGCLRLNHLAFRLVKRTDDFF